MKVPKPKVVKDPKWLATVRQMPCWVQVRFPAIHRCCDTIGSGPSECSHLDTKSRDDRVLPMCGWAHRTGIVAWHRGQQTFGKTFGVIKEELIREAEDLYKSWKEGR